MQMRYCQRVREPDDGRTECEMHIMFSVPRSCPQENLPGFYQKGTSWSGYQARTLPTLSQDRIRASERHLFNCRCSTEPPAPKNRKRVNLIHGYDPTPVVVPLFFAIPDSTTHVFLSVAILGKEYKACTGLIRNWTLFYHKHYQRATHNPKLWHGKQYTHAL